MSKAWTHWGTSQHVMTLRLPTHDAGTRLEGPPLGHAVRGGDFVLDPFDAYRARLVTNPNVVVAGSIGVGKSTVVKMMIERALQRGRRAVIVDPKGEYGSLARAHGVRPFVIGSDGWCWPGWRDARTDREFVATLLECAKGRALSDDERYVVDRHYDAFAARRPPRVLATLFAQLSPHLADSTTTPERTLALLLRRFLQGDLAHIFDGEGPAMTLDEPLVVLDVSRFWGSESISLAALSAVAAAQNLAVREEPGYLVLDEAWALLGDEASMKWLQGSWKLARSRGISHVLVLHRWTDVAAAGAEGSAQRARARGLLRECETVWLFRQPPDEATEMSSILGLSTAETRVLSDLARGEALVRYGRARSVVRVAPTARESLIIDSDAAMRSTGA